MAIRPGQTRQSPAFAEKKGERRMQTGETTRYTFAPLSRAEAIKMRPVSQINQVSTVVRGTPVCLSDDREQHHKQSKTMAETTDVTKLLTTLRRLGVEMTDSGGVHLAALNQHVKYCAVINN